MNPYTDGQYPASESDDCVADRQFIEWFNQEGFSNTRVFHFGSGYHHKVGIELSKNNNSIMSVTISKFEHNRYVELLRENPALANHYKLLHCNIYSLDKKLLPKFDIITLFHLYEYEQFNSGLETYDDSGLLHMLIQNCNKNTLILFFRKSSAFKQCNGLINEQIKIGKLIVSNNYKDLLISKVI